MYFQLRKFGKSHPNIVWVCLKNICKLSQGYMQSQIKFCSHITILQRVQSACIAYAIKFITYV